MIGGNSSGKSHHFMAPPVDKQRLTSSNTLITEKNRNVHARQFSGNSFLTSYFCTERILLRNSPSRLPIYATQSAATLSAHPCLSTSRFLESFVQKRVFYLLILSHTCRFDEAKDWLSVIASWLKFPRQVCSGIL